MFYQHGYLQRSTLFSVHLAFSPRPNIQQARPRKRKAASAAVLTASPFEGTLKKKTNGKKMVKKPKANKKSYKIKRGLRNMRMLNVCTALSCSQLMVASGSDMKNV